MGDLRGAAGSLSNQTGPQPVTTNATAIRQDKAMSRVNVFMAFLSVGG
jgi:hypothetical protein